MTIKFREGHKLPVEPGAALQELERIRKANDGKLRPENIVKEAEPKDAPLHPCFEWRNAVAAHKYRLWQSRQLVKCVVIERTEEGETQRTPAYVHVSPIDGDGKKSPYYQATEVAINHHDEWTSAVINAQGKLASARNAVEALQRIAKGSDDSGRLARLTLATRALDTAYEALRH